MVLLIEWTDGARADIRALDRPTAMRIFEGLYRYALTGAGDGRHLKENTPENFVFAWVTTASSSGQMARYCVSSPSRTEKTLIAEFVIARYCSNPQRVALIHL